jgi:hypothetical protein
MAISYCGINNCVELTASGSGENNPQNPCRLYGHQGRKSIVGLWTILFKLELQE